MSEICHLGWGARSLLRCLHLQRPSWSLAQQVTADKLDSRHICLILFPGWWARCARPSVPSLPSRWSPTRTPRGRPGSSTTRHRSRRYQRLRQRHTLTGVPGWNADCVDERGDAVVWSSWGGLRERAQGLLQEADWDAQQPHHPPSWLSLKRRAAESRESLYWHQIKEKLERWWQSALSTFTREMSWAKWFSTRSSPPSHLVGNLSSDIGIWTLTRPYHISWISRSVFNVTSSNKTYVPNTYHAHDDWQFVKGGTRQRAIASQTYVTPSSATGTSISATPPDLW